jgi:hypothetical protein
MGRADDPIQPMTLGNMRQNGVRGLDVTCAACGYRTEVNVDAFPDDVTVPSFGQRMRCSRCGKLGGHGDTKLDRTTRSRNAAMSLTTEQRRALFLLKTAGRYGMTQGQLSALGFDASLIAGLVEQGFASLTSSKARASGKMIAVRITQAGQDALVES